LAFCPFCFDHCIVTSFIDLDYKFQENAYLKQINVSWNGFDDDGGAAFGDALANNGFLTELDISSCRISTEGFGKLMCGLKSNEELEVLRVFISFIRRFFVVFL
jgi:Ran GTPase-activating protein (RanGAP) involved in mRNA processing and transport